MPATPEVLQGRAAARREQLATAQYELDQGHLSFDDAADLTFDDIDDTAAPAAAESLAASATAAAESLVASSTASAESIIASSTATRETLVS